jgi:hypothetical protein
MAPTGTPRPSTAPLPNHDHVESSSSSSQQQQQQQQRQSRPQPLILGQAPSESPLPSTTPTSATTPQQPPSQSHSLTRSPQHDVESTPTRATFAQSDALASQKPLPTSPFPQAVSIPDSPVEPGTGRRPTRENSLHSRKSRESDDVDNMMDIDDSDTETTAGEPGRAGTVGDDANSDEDGSVGADGRGGKKKKSQRFYCTEYPPCTLSFTRSEHLARHIRKHTGERPFQCHCSRRFSRLDNLRQHAQTVHVNEEIPLDSLASTSRFPRQLRADRRPTAANRARAGTVGSTGPVRGHSKSLSTSSIASIASINSVYSPREGRPRPPPLAVAPSGQATHATLEGGYRNSDGYAYGRPVSPSDFSTPPSATFSTGQNSPHWSGSGIASPISTHSRSQSLYAPGVRTPARRLSVPGGSGNPFASPLGPRLPQVSVGGPAPGSYSPAPPTLLPSPTTSTASEWSQRDSATEDYRRRTWHLDSRAPSSNQNQPPAQAPGSAPGSAPVSAPIHALVHAHAHAHAHSHSHAHAHSHAPAPAPAPVPAPTSNATTPTQFQLNPTGFGIRLPPIASFDPLPPRSRPEESSAMQLDEPEHNRPVHRPLIDSLREAREARDARDDRRNIAQLDINLHRGLTRLDITSSSSSSTPPRDSAGQWANEVDQAVQAQAERVRINPPTVRFEAEPQPSSYTSHGPPLRPFHQHTMSAPSINTSREKRHGWYHAQQASPMHAHHHQSSGPLASPSHMSLQQQQQHQQHQQQQQQLPQHQQQQHYAPVPTEPKSSFVDRIEHPNLSFGFPARSENSVPPAPPAPGMYRQQEANSQGQSVESMGRLQALVAVATSEQTAAY